MCRTPKTHSLLFQSTRSVRSATALLGSRKPMDIFQSTRSVRSATYRHNPAPVPQIRFQSTRSVRSATQEIRHKKTGCLDFNPRAPCGARHQRSGGHKDQANFNPRAPCGARHKLQRYKLLVIDISIHALRAERDLVCFASLSSRAISIHALRAERDGESITVTAPTEKISIHALRAERDSAKTGCRNCASKFQSTRSVRSATCNNL